jgi:energy-coupling factor transporter ATP-binding protein EcfA2
VRRETRWVTGRVLITGPSGSGKSTLAHYFRERGVIAVDGDEVRGLGGPVDLDGRPLRHITKEQWRDIADWRHFWKPAAMKQLLNRNPNVVLFGASDNLFDLDLAPLFDRRIFLRATWSVIWARLNSPTRDNDWGRDSQPAQRDWVRKATREWPVTAKACGFEFIDAELSPARIFRVACDRGSETVGTDRPRTSRGQSTTPRRRSGPHVSSRK